MPKGKGYNLEKDIEGLGARHKKPRAKLKARMKKKEEDWVERLKRNVKMLLQGSSYKVPKKK